MPHHVKIEGLFLFCWHGNLQHYILQLVLFYRHQGNFPFRGRHPIIHVIHGPGVCHGDFPRVVQRAIHRQKLLALALTFAGCVLVTGYLPGTGNAISAFGLLVRLDSGLGYSLYSIFARLPLVNTRRSPLPPPRFCLPVFSCCPPAGYGNMPGCLSTRKPGV